MGGPANSAEGFRWHWRGSRPTLPEARAAGQVDVAGLWSFTHASGVALQPLTKRFYRRDREERREIRLRNPG
jgi:hypothetical protein